MSRLWFTADTHFGHAKIIQHSRRPFADVAEMDAMLIARWNDLVGERDTVWHLGDFCHWRCDPEPYRKQLKGRIHLVYGNHDEDARKVLAGLFDSVQDVKYLRHDGERLWLSHYPHRSWRNSHHGSYHLFGHCHGDLPSFGRSMDVGVDACNYAPISFDVVTEMLYHAGPTLQHPSEKGSRG